MASTSNAENFMKIARIDYQLCDYTDFRVDFLQTRIYGKWLVFANQVTYITKDTVVSEDNVINEVNCESCSELYSEGEK